MRHVLSVDNDYLILDNPIIELGDRSPLSNHKGEIIGQSLFVKTKIDDITLERLATFDDIGKEAKQLGYILVPYTEEQEVQEVQIMKLESRGQFFQHFMNSFCAILLMYGTDRLLQ